MIRARVLLVFHKHYPQRRLTRSRRCVADPEIPASHEGSAHVSGISTRVLLLLATICSTLLLPP
jgi:hypothetical protein